MNLHRSSGRPDWETIPAGSQNVWQRVAVRGHGVLTPANVVTVLGFVLVLLGLGRIAQHAYWAGLVLGAIGRLADVADGMVAEATGTKSPLGEALDASFDKLAILAAFIVLIVAHIISLPVAVLLSLPNVSNALLTVWAVRRGAVLHPSQAGKLGMATACIALGCFILAVSLDQSRTALLYQAGYLFVLATVVLGVRASRQYYQVAAAK